MFGQLPKFTRPRFCAANRTKFRHRFPILGDDDGVAARRVLDKPRELRLGFVQIDLPAHKPILNSARYVVNELVNRLGSAQQRQFSRLAIEWLKRCATYEDLRF